MIPALLLALANLAPAVVPLFTNNETAEKAASAAATIATTIVGTDSVDEAAKAILGNAELEAEFRAQITERAVSLYAAETERLKVEIEDRASARRMFVETADVTPRNLAYYAFAIWSFVTVWMVTQGMPDGVDAGLVQRALGIMDAIVLAIVGFYFGSSLGSKTKDERGKRS